MSEKNLAKYPDLMDPSPVHPGITKRGRSATVEEQIARQEEETRDEDAQTAIAGRPVGPGT